MTERRHVVFSGIQPTGELHLGNYLGAIKNWVELQERYNCVYCIVDYHAITSDYNPQKLGEDSLHVAIDLVSCGIDPDNSILFVQSHVPEHTELAWILQSLTPYGELTRMTQFKAKSSHQARVNTGLFCYPVLQAADILLYFAEKIPVGEDQIQHIELTRDIARKFNAQFGETFPPVEPLLTRGARLMSLRDPTQKMSKSLGPKHYIALRDSPDMIREKLAGAVTDVGPESEGEGMSAGVQNLFLLIELLGDPETSRTFQEKYDSGKLFYEELKSTVSDLVVAELEPIHERREALLQQPGRMVELLSAGGRRAQDIARQNIQTIRQKLGLLEQR